MDGNRMGLTTSALAAQLHLRPQTLRAALCRVGHYYGVRPARLANGRLIWPDDALERLTEAGATTSTPAQAI